MALNPSRRDTIGPPPRDLSDLAAHVRHQGSYLRSLDPGILGGTRATPRPVRGGPGSQIVGGGGDGDGSNYEWQWEDRGIVRAAGDQAFHLTYEPIEESLFVRWHPDGRGGLPITNEHFTVVGQEVLIPASGVFATGDQFSFQYQFDPGVTPEVVEFAALGYTHEFVSNPIPLPVGTQIGDTILLIVMNQRGWVGTVNDSRLSLVASSPVVSQTGGNVSTDVYMGTASSLDNIGVTGVTWPVAAVVTFAGYMGHGATAQTFGVLGDIALPTLDVGSSLLVLTQNNGIVVGIAPSTLAPGYVEEGRYPGSTYSVWNVYAYSGDSPTPSGTTNQGFTTGDGAVFALAIEVTP